MIAQADVLIESYRPGVMDKLGLGYEEAEKLNPRLVYCSVSSFGHRGPYAKKPGYDIIAQANSGIMYMTGEAGGSPMKVALTMGDYVGAINALGGIMTALYYRERTGLGQHVDISLARGLTWFNGVFDYPVSKIPKGRSGNHADNLCPYGIFNGREGSIVLGAVNLLTWQHLCECMGRTELIEDPRYRTNADRCEHKQEVIELVESWVNTFQRIDDACAVLDAAGVPAAKIKSPDEVYLDPHVVECGWVQNIPTPNGIHTADSVPGCVGLAQGVGGMVLVSLIIVTWFNSHQGAALGICAAGSGLATVVCPPVITAIIERSNLSAAFLAEAGFILLCAAAVFAVIRNCPAEKSVTAYHAAQVQQKKVDNYGGDVSRPAFAVLCALYLLLGGIMVVDTGYVSTLYAESGHSAVSLSLLLSINGVLLAVGKVLYGTNADRRGGHWANRVFLSLLLAGQLLHCCSPSGSYPLAVLAQIATGIGLPVGTVGVSITAMNFSSQENFPRQVKVMQTMVNVGLLAFSMVPGVLADISGHYRISFVLCAGMVAVYFLVLELLYFYKGRTRAEE